MAVVPPPHSSLTYEGYDPSWIIGTHSDSAQNIIFGPTTAALYTNGYRAFFDYYDPHRVPVPVTPNIYRQVPQHGPAPKIAVLASKATPHGPVLTTIPPPKVHIVKPGGPGGPGVVPHPHGLDHNLGLNHGHKNIVVLKVPFCCDGCEKKWKDKLTNVPGFMGLNVERMQHKIKLTVFGNMETHTILDTVRKVQPRTEIWRLN